MFRWQYTYDIINRKDNLKQIEQKNSQSLNEMIS